MRNLWLNFRIWMVRRFAGRDIGVAINLLIQEQMYILQESDKAYLIDNNVIDDEAPIDEESMH